MFYMLYSSTTCYIGCESSRHVSMFNFEAINWLCKNSLLVACIPGIISPVCVCFHHRVLNMDSFQPLYHRLQAVTQTSSKTVKMCSLAENGHSWQTIAVWLTDLMTPPPPCRQEWVGKYTTDPAGCTIIGETRSVKKQNTILWKCLKKATFCDFMHAFALLYNKALRSCLPFWK